MNKYLTLTLSLALVASSAMASEVLVGTAAGFKGQINSTEPEEGHVSLVLNAEHHRPLTDQTGYFVASNVYVAKAPVSAGLVVGGVYKAPAVPVSAQFGLSLDVANSSEGSYQVAPGLMIGSVYNMTDAWALKAVSIASFPTNSVGEYNRADFTASVGLSRSFAVDA
jgi:hypothetical protein